MPAQLLLYNWLEYYDWILGPEGPSPKPSQEILEDDESLDAFIKNWKDSFKPKEEKGSGHFEIS